MILRPLPHYQRSFKYSTVRIVSFGAWQNLELVGQTGDFVNWIKKYIFFESFCAKPIITLRTWWQTDLTKQPRLMVNSLYRSSWILNGCNLSCTDYSLTNCRIIIKIGPEKITYILSEVWKQTTPDSSVYLKHGVKRLVYTLPDLQRATHTKNPAWFLFWAFLYTER